MKYTNGFTINAAGNECFIQFLQSRPDGQQGKKTEELDTIVMSETCARQLLVALAQVYNKVDSDRKSQKTVDVKETVC